MNSPRCMTCTCPAFGHIRPCLAVKPNESMSDSEYQQRLVAIASGDR